MSVELNKLNRAGFGGGTTGVKKKSSGIASQATKNLANSSAASKSSIFSVKSSNKFHFTAGVNNVKNMHKANYQGVRASLNSRTYTPSNTGYVSSASSNVQYNVQNGMSKAMMTGQVIGQIAGGVFGLLNQTGILGGGDKVQTQSNTKQLDQILSGGNNTSISLASGSAASAISGMSSAQDASSLRGAIVSANAQLSSLQAQSGVYNNQATAAQKLIESQGQLTQEKATAEEGTKTAKNDLGSAKEQLRATQAGRDNLINSVSQLNASYGKAVQQYTQARDANVKAKADYTQAQSVTSQCQSSYDSALSAYNSTPEKIQDANGNMIDNPAKARAKTVMDNAKTRLDQAKQKEAAAKEKQSQTESAEKTANTAKTKAAEQLGAEKDKVEEAEKKLKSAQDLVDKKNTGLSTAEATLEKATEKEAFISDKIDSAKSAVEELKVYNQNVKELTNAIAKENKRLTSLEEKAEKYDNKASKGITKNTTKYNEMDTNHNHVIDADETNKFRTRGMERRNERINNNISSRDAADSDYQFTKWKNETLMKQSPITVNGEAYRKGTAPNGQEVYYRGTMPIDEDTYKKAVGVSA